MATVMVVAMEITAMVLEMDTEVMGYRPLGWGLGGWGLGSLGYNSGYLGYANPYYTTTGSSGYNYSQPIPVAYNTTLAVASTDPNSG